ncbi:hypothetical protein H257_09833 [Aphanomyces astaci]|uniref:Uncharacterized protein n=1 Tax=Aphanomyces astaci TaxID=112090 RepID=W4GA71_APHAT|nr:hypothetical protein H257_09833 [Aphanomyces astaci]ETV75858.1 hypothetical protein H257_09833 [Aphanomyces astaci]|eukprot:XP_009834500.1 hypothetical protein H257_09833 [Aphanomyces astaci]
MRKWLVGATAALDACWRGVSRRRVILGVLTWCRGVAAGVVEGLVWADSSESSILARSPRNSVSWNLTWKPVTLLLAARSYSSNAFTFLEYPRNTHLAAFEATHPKTFMLPSYGRWPVNASMGVVVAVVEWTTRFKMKTAMLTASAHQRRAMPALDIMARVISMMVLCARSATLFCQWLSGEELS